MKHQHSTDATVITQKPQEVENACYLQEAENLVNTLNRLTDGAYYIVDYNSNKIITGSGVSLILGGHKKNVADTEGFAFFNRILDNDELDWMNRVNVAYRDFFSDMPIEERMELILSYDLTVKATNGEKHLLHHEVTPLRLQNYWLSLFYITEISTISSRALIVNFSTGEKYTYIRGRFEKD